jgi:CheY-like chemotaxis protein
MPLRRALVVDDSKSARIALKKQLEKYNLSVDLADSGEEALEFLKDHNVDVVFMDHVMPGMDGLQTVTALKSNPRTATTPVMMYTSKEGEVYVSQARALGAVDVLPKQVEPGVLFGMLLKLGLVRDRRAPDYSEFDEHLGIGVEADDSKGAEEPVGMPVPALLNRILEDQHSALRSEMLKSHRSFAKQVAYEIHKQQKADALAEAENAPEQRAEGAGLPMLTGILAATVLLLGMLFFQARSERDALRDDLGRLSTAIEQERLSSFALNRQLTDNFDDAGTRSEMAMLELLNTLTWAMNESGTVPFGEVPFNAVRAEQISRLLTQLVNAGFQGTVRIESHLGEFCLASDATGTYQLVEPELPFTACALIGHPLEGSNLLSSRQTQSFESFVAESPLVNGSGIELEVIARDRLDSVARVQYPADPVSAGEWNRAAAQNNRLVYSLLAIRTP